MYTTIKIILLLALLLAVIVLAKKLMDKLPGFRDLCYSVGICVLLTVVVFYILGYFNII